MMDRASREEVRGAAPEPARRAAHQDELESIRVPVIQELDVLNKGRNFLDFIDNDGLYSIRCIELADEETGLHYVAATKPTILQVQEEGARSFG